MYYIAKALEVLGMFVIAAGFIMNFPGLMGPKFLLAGLMCCGSGWVIENYILK